jgi:uncharacterized protein YjbI with pentapeptide repeats
MLLSMRETIIKLGIDKDKRKLRPKKKWKAGWNRERHKTSKPNPTIQSARLSLVTDGEYSTYNVSRVNLNGVQLDLALMYEFIFNKVSMQRASFTNASLLRGQFLNTNAKKIIFEHTTMRGISFKNVNFSEAKFDNVIMRNVVFEKCDLSDAVLRDSMLDGVEFKNCNLSRVNFSQSNLIGIEVSVRSLPDLMAGQPMALGNVTVLNK